MTRIALPLVPAGFVALGFMLTIGGLITSMIPPQAPDIPEIEVIEAAPPTEVPTLPYHIAPQAKGYHQVILNRSPFVEDRGSFQDVSAMSATPSQPTRPEIKLQLVGVAIEGGDHIALLIRNDTQALNRYRISDETPIGRIVAISSDGVMIDEDGKQKSMRLYEDSASFQ